MNSPRPRKRFGQHFLHDPGVIARIVAAIGPQTTDHLVEIGPGRGALTIPLARAVARLDAIELDRDLAAGLQAIVAQPSLVVHQADALRFDFAALGDDLRLVGNLPYNISTPLLFHVLDNSHLFRDMHVMLQREVVERMSAGPGSRAYGRLTVALAARCRVERLFVIRPGAFNPPPQVDSAFARLVPEPGRWAQVRSQQAFDRVLNAAFSMRRKQLVNSLGTLFTATALKALDINPEARPETLDVSAFVRLGNALASRDTGLE